MPEDRHKFVKQFVVRTTKGTLRDEDFESRDVLIRIKRAVFERVNADRRAHGLGAVAYDKLAAQAGEAHCREMLAHGFVSHWNLRGLKPYHRYSFSGGADGLAENAAGADATHDAYHSIEEVAEAALESHAAMLAEVPPNDGHRRTILNPAHTHVGIGLAFNRRGMRMTQEFLQRYVEVKTPRPPAIPSGGEFVLRARLLDPAHRVEVVAVYFDPPPRPLSLGELHRTGSYSFPDEVSFEYPVVPFGMRYQDGSTGSVVVGRGGDFQCALKFKRGRPGLYTVCVWIKDHRGLSIPATNLTLQVG